MGSVALIDAWTDCSPALLATNYLVLDNYLHDQNRKSQGIFVHIFPKFNSSTNVIGYNKVFNKLKKKTKKDEQRAWWFRLCQYPK